MLAYDFMQHAFAAATIVALVSGPVGYFLVLRGQTFASHALSHVGFTGATGAVLLGTSPIWGLVLLTIAAGIGMGLLGERLENRDVAIGIVLALSLGFGLLFLHFFTAFAAQATSLLFGNVLAVDLSTIWSLLVLGVISLTGLGIIARPLLFASIQPELAEARGIRLRLFSVLFLAIVALATAECAQIVGVLLVFTLMVGPAAAAHHLTTNVGAGMILSSVLALLEAWLGITFAFYTDWPCSFWITAFSALFYFVSIVSKRRRRQVRPEHPKSREHKPIKSGLCDVLKTDPTRLEPADALGLLAPLAWLLWLGRCRAATPKPHLFGQIGTQFGVTGCHHWIGRWQLPLVRY